MLLLIRSVKECLQPKCFYTNRKLKEHDKGYPREGKRNRRTEVKAKEQPAARTTTEETVVEVAELTFERRREALHKGRNRNEELWRQETRLLLELTALTDAWK